MLFLLPAIISDFSPINFKLEETFVSLLPIFVNLKKYLFHYCLFLLN